MELDLEIEVKKGLAEAATQSRVLDMQGSDLKRQAENTLADAAEWAYKQGANVSLIASALHINRQRVYMLLAMKGIRPGKEVANA